MSKLTKDRLYIATFSKGAVALADEHGLGLEINDFCISQNLDDENRDKVIERIAKMSEGGSRKTIMHGPFTELTPSAIDPLAIKLMDERYAKTIEACSRLTIKDLVLHDGYLPLIYHKEWHKKKSVEYWKRFADALPGGMTVYIENVFDDEPFLLTEIIDAVDCDAIKICLDIGHANCVTLPERPVTSWISEMGSRIGHMHIHNNDGTADLHDHVFSGNMNFDAIMRAVERELPDDVTVTIESRDAAPSVEYIMKNFLEG